MLKLGICGTNNSHVVRYTELVNQPQLPRHRKVGGARVVVAFFAYDEENVKELQDLGVKTQVEFRVYAHGEKGIGEAIVTDGANFYRNTMRQMVKFFCTGKSPIDHRDTLEVIKILAALVKSRKAGDRVYLKEL